MVSAVIVPGDGDSLETVRYMPVVVHRFAHLWQGAGGDVPLLVNLRVHVRIFEPELNLVAPEIGPVAFEIWRMAGHVDSEIPEGVSEVESDIIRWCDESKLIQKSVCRVPVGQPLNQELDARTFGPFVNLDSLAAARHRIVLDRRPVADPLEVIDLAGYLCGLCYRCADAHERAENQRADLHRVAWYPVIDQSPHLDRSCKAGVLVVVGAHPGAAHATDTC